MLKIFNTLTKKKEIFKPIKKNKVSMYVCGVTVYDYCHIGHAKTFLFFDVVYRYFKKYGYSVKYVRNITDIDDKIINKSKLIKKDYTYFTRDIINDMNLDFSSLNILKPTFSPLATDHIIEIISFINFLINKKHAYINNKGDVVFDIKSYSEYGILSRKNYFNKINFLKKDFTLWKKSKLGENFWNSPWGNGRPGWHIECSAINYKYFKDKLDIHGGGNDLIFPHHENERAQSVCFQNNNFVNYWMHTGMVICKKKKMSKSLKNFYLIKDLRKNFNSDVIRHYILSTNYRHPINYNINDLKKSEKILKKFYYCLKFSKNKNFNFSLKENFINDIILFKKAMNDSFNTPIALFLLSKLSNKIIYANDSKKFKKAEFFSEILYFLGKTLGFFSNKDNFVKKNKKLIIKIKKLLKKRNDARKLFLWKKADNIRKKLLNLGVHLEDKKNETIWKIY
ncbi:MAG: cysteine--tRNA ligase [Buchnera aphidicola (Periphyllus lyropictus)]|uniref:cysteine--tRNA ligase n=1 Tax=Buchnera aphidicola TaxID=9 RepID=UPI001ED523C5|nr:cysteine--tRNA ligase [Buchnera aphidicola]NIH16506.1 cysteine--tRNA ligase [Buchnera aphidicola (Periphyllus lyropictus)]USS94791.1 cysteine--tRNA ligase [Buchnera aphidicola (Periphyllus lyropictus)]